MISRVITRFAPSPTGFLHVGGARTALFNYLFAKQNKGKIILRIEDTDKERNKPEYVDGIFNAFNWLGIKFDETIIQSQNLSTHKRYLEKLIKENKAYISKEEPHKEGQRDSVIRFRNPCKKIIFNDLIKGEIKFDTTELGDFVIAKSIEEPIFHFANVIDDISSEVTHVIRGEEHLSNTPRQILIWEAVGERPLPIYGHIPLILSPAREKISKRKHGEIVAVEYYKDNGYLPEALINFLAFLGWNPGGTEEFFSLEELIKIFDIKKVQKGGAIFNIDKLNWYNKEYIKKMPKEKRVECYKEELTKLINFQITYEIINKIDPIITDRIIKFGDIRDMFNKGEIQYFFIEPKWEKKSKFFWKGKGDSQSVVQILTEIIKLLESIKSSEFSAEIIKQVIWPYTNKLGRGEVLWPTRYALSGLEKSPDPFSIADVLGKERTIKRLKAAISFLESGHATK